jgi:glycerol-3-phosphate acyltransferase PlsY
MLGALVIACYLVGSIPVAWLIAKLATGQDLRRMGSGNVGVMNAAISVGRWAGGVVFLAEAAKGALAVFLARALLGDEVAIGLAVLATFVGTRWPIWLGGAGGRGNTAAVAALLAVSWPTLLSILALWILARFVTRGSFTATRASLLLWPYLFGLITWSWWSVLLGAFISLLFLSTHRPETDDHQLIKARWVSLWAFLTAPRRNKSRGA